MGRSALALNFSLNIARQMQVSEGAYSVHFHSLELSGDDLGARVLSIFSGVSAHRFRTARIDGHEYERLVDTAMLLNELPLHVGATGNHTIEAIVSATMAEAQRNRTGLIVIDTLSLLQDADTRDVARRLKGMARDLSVPVVITADVSRNADGRDNKRPTLMDIDEGLEEFADCIIAVYRERVYLERSEPALGSVEFLTWRAHLDACANVAELLVLKQRNGPIGTVDVGYNVDTTEFMNLAR